MPEQSDDFAGDETARYGWDYDRAEDTRSACRGGRIRAGRGTVPWVAQPRDPALAALFQSLSKEIKPAAIVDWF